MQGDCLLTHNFTQYEVVHDSVGKLFIVKLVIERKAQPNYELLTFGR